MRSASARGSSVLPVHIALFGAPHVTAADGMRRFPLPRKTLDVLAYLILNRRRMLARANVAFSLFPDEDEDVARASLRRNLFYLLSALPPVPQENPFVLTDGDAIGWNAAAPASIDVDEFESALSENRDDDAIAAYGGELLPTLYGAWTTTERERLRTSFHDALVRTMQRDRSLRRFDPAITAARRLLDDDPWREDIVRQLMAMRHESGDRSGALAEFERLAVQLRSEMNAEPMPETIALRNAVLRGSRLATTEPAKGPRLAAGSPLPGLPFVGRDAAMERARSSWHRAADGRASILFIAGEAGVGKSRFATELARTIDREGGFVLRGETSAGGEYRPYEAFLEALRHADRDVERLLDEHAGATLTDDRAARVRLFDAVRRSVAELATTRPVAIILEDFHWASSDTIDLLDFITFRLNTAPILIIVTARTDEFARAHPLRALLRQLESRGTASMITLPRLTSEEATRALLAVSPARTDSDIIARAVAWADGIALLLAEALDALAAGRPLPTGNISALVGDRFARLTPPAATAVTFGALIGARFELATLAAATGWSDDVLVEALGESLELGLVRTSSNAPGLTFVFSHHIVHAAARDCIPPRDRIRAHAMIAQSLAALSNSTTSRAAEIARQFEAAGAPLRAASFFLHAARYGLAVFANDDARENATAGLHLAGDEAGLRYELLSVREHALRRAGAVAESREDSMEMLACAGNDPERLRDALERVFEAYRDDDGARAMAVKRLEELAPLSDRHAATHERVAAKLAFLAGNFPDARDAARRAAALFHRTGDERAALMAELQHISALYRLSAFEAADLAIASLRPGIEASEDSVLRAEFYRVACSDSSDERREQALADGYCSLELAIRVGDRYTEARARQSVAALLAKLRNFEESLRENERALLAYRDVGDETGTIATLLNTAALRVGCGETREARRLLEALPSEASRQPWLGLRIWMLRGLIDRRDGHFSRADAALRTARVKAEELGSLLWVARADVFLGELAASLGQLDAARTLLDAALVRLASLGQPGLSCEVHALSARLYAGIGDAAAARDEACHARSAIASAPVQGLSEAAWHLAATYALLNDRETAQQFAAAAASAFADDALHMSAELLDAFARLPWHVDAIAYLAGRDVPLRLNERHAGR
jgi:DNA-binding SARP family transcriptional activator/predicted ATPase